MVFNEINTIPGFTAHSRYPGMMRAAGLPFGELITRLVELGWKNERHFSFCRRHMPRPACAGECTASISGRGTGPFPALGAEDILLEKTAAALLAECVRAAGAAGEVVPVSGWRPRAQQQSIWNDTMEKEGEAFTKQFVAKPGCSEHETGLAIDLAQCGQKH